MMRTTSRGRSEGDNAARMKPILDLFAAVAHRVQPPVCIAHGPPWPAANVVQTLGFPDTVCYQMDLHQAGRMRECLAELGANAEVAAFPDLWDLEPALSKRPLSRFRPC